MIWTKTNTPLLHFSNTNWSTLDKHTNTHTADLIPYRDSLYTPTGHTGVLLSHFAAAK